MADGDVLPSYNALFPEEETNTVINGRRRYTTITLREIYYPGGCPCHPKEKKLSKKRKTRTTDHLRAFSESEQRKFESFDKQQRQQQQQQQQLFKSDEHGRFQHEWPGPVRRFEILKSTTLGLVCPQNLLLSVIDADVGTVHTDRLIDLSTLPTFRHEPAFVTSTMKWWKQKFILPPSFQIMPGTAVQGHPQHKWLRGGDFTQTGSEVTGQLRETFNNSPPDEPYPLAEINYQGWQGFTRMSISLTLYNITPDMHYALPATQDPQNPVHEIRSHYTIARRGWKREYTMTGSPSSPNYKWHSPPSHNSEVLSTPAVDDGFHPANGNLLLEDSQGTLVAVYKQRRDHQVLGALTVFLANVAGGTSRESHLDENGFGNGHGLGHRRERGHGHESRSIEIPDRGISLEAVVASCLAVVVYERVGWQNLLGN
ncbi:uncharacterized protein Z520_03690 [Fonsecaea multimorphosa CBS 102226]|uniref:Uncharacterized protein n=1 Tax=Fonsecaea multimorphosa CBS 102226 TaxID=1442371 RepID=A0A0D2KW79_9EURO|nr:uncharacterized protein Z520_03690 [Fonsecaea multimorphosa CBS 102226]KIY01024.1 hypothetical protein Z520_03690 [Fonsecaea multimorphosa CBS 102226]